MLGEFVGDVAGVEIGKYEHVGAARDVAHLRHLARRNSGGKRCVTLKFAIDQDIGMALADDLQCGHHLVGVGMRAAALGRE